MSELHLGKFPDSLEFQIWRVHFKTEVCANSAFLHITLHLIKKVEIANSTDDLLAWKIRDFYADDEAKSEDLVHAAFQYGEKHTIGGLTVATYK